MSYSYTSRCFRKSKRICISLCIRNRWSKSWGYLKLHSKKKLKQIYLENKQFFVEVLQRL